MTTNAIFFNQVFDKKRLKVLIAWVFKEFGEKQALRVVEELKTIGFYNATQAGLSIGLNDLTTPSQKSFLLSQAEVEMNLCDQDFNGGRITATERNQRIVDTWHRVSETLRKQVVEHFSTYDQLNPVYIMALSGARGNFSQVRQLVGMRGLMADPQGQIISFPIRSNLREGLTLTEYFISCSGARKGLVDTALRTADTGYLTRRLVDVSHHVVIKKICCNTEKGITIRALKSENKLLLSLSDRLVGRVLAQNIEYSEKAFAEDVTLPSLLTHREKLPSFYKQNDDFTEESNRFLAQKNQEIDPKLALKIQAVSDQVKIRSPLTCAFTHSVCQLCYGWSLSQGRLVSLGEAVGVIAAQSIGEPGTQLTMRTFHTGGVFSGDLLQEMRAPHSGKITFSKAFQGLMIRTTDGRIAFLTKTSGEILLKKDSTENEKMKASYPGDITEKDISTFSSDKTEQKKQTSLQFQPLSLLFVRQSETVKKNQLLAQISILGEEGNQPIKSRQTVFAELSGKVFETQGATTTKKFIKNINKVSKSTETSLLKNEIVNTLKGRLSNSIHPEKSAKIGFFHILATQIAATFDVNKFSITLPSKAIVQTSQASPEKQSLSSYYKQNNDLAVSHFASVKNPRQAKLVRAWSHNPKQISQNLHLQNLNKQLQKLRFSNCVVSSEANVSSNFTGVTTSNHLAPLSGNEKAHSSFDSFNTFDTSKTSKFFKTKPFVLRRFALQNGTKRRQQSFHPLQNKAFTAVKASIPTESKDQTKSREALLLRGSSRNFFYNPYTAQFFSSTHNKAVVVSLLHTQISKKRRVNSRSYENSSLKKLASQSLTVKQSEFARQNQTVSAAFNFDRRYSSGISTASKITKIYKQTQQKTDCFFLQTIAQEGDLVDFKYKEASFKNL